MFRTGRRSTTLLRATAGLGVALMLAGLYRPGLAFATVDAAKGPPAATTGASRAASSPSAQTPAARPPAATSAPAERVRGAIVPTALRLERGPGATGLPGGADPWALFDGDGAVAFNAAEAVRVRVSLPGSVALEAIGVYGATDAVVTASADGPAGPKPIAGFERMSLRELPARWNRFQAENVAEVSTLLLDFVPAPGQRAEVREIELWGRAARAPSARPASGGAWAEALLTHLPPGAVQVAASPASASISGPVQGAAGGFTFTFNLDRAGRTFERAFLVYELEGMAHWSAVVRRINWQSQQGGFHSAHAAGGGLQVEEISPAWLRQGKNDLGFYVSNLNDLQGYTLKNVRVVGLPAAGDVVARLAADATPAGAGVRSLVDGNKETGLTNKDIRKAQVADFRFAGPSQPDSLLVAVDKGAKGSITAEPIVKGKVQRRSQASAELDQLGTGWARIPLGDLAPEADGIRVTIRGAGGESVGGLVSELRVMGSRLPGPRAPGIEVTYPLHGECVDGEAYVRGFLRPDASGTTKGATLRIRGSNRAGALAADGAFAAVVAPPPEALRSGGKWQIELEARFANGDLTGAAVDVEGCKEPVAVSKAGPVEDVGAPFGRLVRASEGATLAFAGATLNIPPGALEKDTRITVRPISDLEVPATDESLTNVTTGGRAYRLGPHGLKFAKAVALTIPFDRDRFVGGQAEDDLGAYYFDDQAKRWRQVQTLKGDGPRQTLTAATEHFTDFIAGTISSPDHPTADSFNPTSIKDMKAADPAAGINLIAPPEPSPDGAAHISFPIWVPPGRQGMQPSLAVAYNSEAGNGPLGVGWDLPISSIGVDTRFGVPRYDLVNETETYALDGELLVMDPGQAARGLRTTFHRRSEGKFDTIIRHGPGGPTEIPTATEQIAAAYRWEVVDKRGTHFFYGETYSARGSIVQRGVFRWHLSRVVDAFGNQMLFTYDKQFPTMHPTPTAVPTVAVYPKTIHYTANSSGQNAAYRVEFLYDGDPNSTIVRQRLQRPDVFTNARGGSLEVTSRRLAHIAVYEAGRTGIENIRRYDFPYGTGHFGKSLLSAIVVAQGPFPGDVDVPGGNEFYRHSFNYLKFSENVFEPPVAWTGADNAGLSDTKSDSINGAVMGGWGPGGCALFHGVVGGSVSTDIPIPLPDIFPHTNEDKVRRGLVDVNGDGLPDLVGSGSVRQNTGPTTRSFVSSPLTGAPGDVSHASRFSAGLNVGIHAVHEAVHAGGSKTWGSSGDDVVLADIDGNGFVDYLTSETFLLNHGQGFTQGKGWGTLPASAIMSADAIAEQKASFTLVDPVIQWTAPMSGNVRITGAAQKLPNFHPATNDGVMLFLDSFGDRPSGNQTVVVQTSRWSERRIDTTPCTPTPLPATTGCGTGRILNVRRGDRVYFRVDSIDDIEDDIVNWNPVISYIDLTDDFGNNPQPVTDDMRALREPFTGGAFDFMRSADFRLAGKPIPVWRSDSKGTEAVGIVITGNITKGPTSDDVTFEILKLAVDAPPNTAPTVVPLSAAQQTVTLSPLAGGATVNASTTVRTGDRIFFRVSSASPIDSNQIQWTPHVRYARFCRLDTVPAGAQNFSGATTFCGAPINCASAAGGGQCQLQGDPNAANNPQSASVIEQDVSPYFELKRWAQIGAPVGIAIPSNGHISFTSSKTGIPARLMIRDVNRRVAVFDVSGPLTTGPSVELDVSAGDVLMFDVFYSTPPANIDQAFWRVVLNFTGTSGSINKTFFARKNVLGDAGGGNHHGWSVFEWNNDLVHPFDAVAEVAVQRGLALGFGDTINQTPGNTNGVTPVRMMRPSPQGLQPPPPAPSTPGPLWVGASVDGFSGPGFFKPSRMAKPITGTSVSFSHTSTKNTDSGASAILGIAHDTSEAHTEQMLLDMNGDRFPDLVTNGTVRYNRVVNSGKPVVTGFFESTSSPFTDANGNPLALGDLRFVTGSSVTASLGISSPVAAYRKVKGEQQTPGWVSTLPSMGIGYGHSTTHAQLMDFNGDGLPDYVARDGGGRLTVRMNLGYAVSTSVQNPANGYSFSAPIDLSTPTWSGGAGVPSPNITRENFSATPAGFEQEVEDSLETARSDAIRLDHTATNNIGTGYAWFGGTGTASVTRTTSDMIDINGDGLPDMVTRPPGGLLQVKFNSGAGFLPEQFFAMPDWGLGSQGIIQQVATVGFGNSDALSFSESSGLSFSAGTSSYWETGIAGCFGFEVGAGAGSMGVGSEMRFEDIDGDGAPDQVLKLAGDSQIRVRRNGALGHDGIKPNLLQRVDNPLGGGFTMAYRRMGNVVDAPPEPNQPDPPDRVDMPEQQLALWHVNAFSGFGSNPIQDGTNVFIDYGVTPSPDIVASQNKPSGFYSRTDREFLGYRRMTLTYPGDVRQVQRKYDNKSYERKHLLLEESTRNAPAGAPHALFRRTERTYDDRPVFVRGTTTVIPGAKFPALTSERTSFYEGLTNDQNAPIRSTTTRHDYDDTGNPISMSDLGDDDLAVPGDDLHYGIGYQFITDAASGAVFPRANNVFACSVPVTPTVPCATANILGHRSAFFGPQGEMRTLVDTLFGGKDPITGNPYVINQTDNPVSAFEYDGFGNLQISTDSNGYKLLYTYDSVANTHIATIKDSFGYESSRGYNMSFGALSDTVDVNGQRSHTRYDVFGRADQFCGPGDVVATGQSSFVCSATPTITFSYEIPALPSAAPFHALTKHRDVGRISNPNNDTLDTVVISDGFGRVRQVKKDAFVGVDGRILSGRVTFDHMGRVYQEGFPTFEQAGNSQQTAFAPWPNVPYAKTNAYDVVDRLRAVQTPDDKGADVAPDGTKVVTTLIDYNAKLLDGRMQLATTVQDAQGKLRTQYLSPNGEILAVSEQNRIGPPPGTPTVLTTRYFHDRLSQLKQVQDPSGNVTTADYDSVGHMVLLASPDAGQTEWRYDTAGKLAAKETANLRLKGQLVKYGYETNRLKTITYPSPTVGVTYTYGPPVAPGAPNPNNQAGRISRVQDESGVETRTYDALGNVKRMEKTPETISPSIPRVTYKMDYVYDLFGRVLKMTYPDDGVVTYGYDAGGNVNSVEGKRKGVTTTYVSNLTYNQLGQRQSLTLGNGWNSVYFPYPDTKRLGTIITTRGTAKIQSLSFGYDLVGNITGISNNLPALPPVPPNTVIAPGLAAQTFNYDDLYQLTAATGRYLGCAAGCGNERRFALTMEYDALGNIKRKTQNDAINRPNGTSTPQSATTYDNVYTYSTRPHAPASVGGTTLTYDADGNQTQYSGSFGPSRALTWTEDDRLRTETDSGFTTAFLYDADGNRSHKRRTTLETWYVNPLYVVKNSLTESKHIMLGGDRIVTEVATITNRADPTTAGPSTLFYYHPDHLQSTSYVTGADGSILQHDEYFPTGEVWFQEQKNNDARNTQPFLFSAKELDETGLYYFGARYYNPKISVWTSPDPTLGQYLLRGADHASPANLNAYSYAWNNPIMLGDPDGRMVGYVPVVTPGPTGGPGGGMTDVAGRPIGFRGPPPVVRGGPRMGPTAGYTALLVAAFLAGLYIAQYDAEHGTTFGVGGPKQQAPGAQSGTVLDPSPMSRIDAPGMSGENIDAPGPDSSCCVSAPGTPNSGPMTMAGPNKVGADKTAEGPHTGFKRDPQTGRISGYTEFDATGNPVKRFRGEGRPHGGMNPPLILEPKAGKGPGAQPKVPRPPRSDEKPKGY